jgi:nucleotide-binding universal stress UspA family protein
VAGDLKVVAWITESGWEACVDAVARLDAAEVTLVHVATPELPGPRGRRHDEVLARMSALADEAAEALLEDAAERLGHDNAYVLAAHGPPEEAVMDAAAEADVLVIVRDNRHPAPHSIGHSARFVVDHAPCAVLLVWPGGGPEGPPPKPKPKPKGKPKPKPPAY